jgi:8-oxo-dGTP pyrophosphatase MutT (NUDIX family)
VVSPNIQASVYWSFTFLLPLIAVDIYAILKSDEGSHLLLVVQYRPAIEKYAIEFPSGKIESIHCSFLHSLNRFVC